MIKTVVHFAIGPNAISNRQNLPALKKHFYPDFVIENWPSYGNTDIAGYLPYILTTEARKGNVVKTILVLTYLPEASIRPRLVDINEDTIYNFHVIADILAKPDAWGRRN